jgi:hypothetical protein
MKPISFCRVTSSTRGLMSQATLTLAMICAADSRAEPAYRSQ